MSLFGSMMFDMDDDSIFGLHMRSLRQMNHMMNSMMSDPLEWNGMFRGLEAITGPPHGLSTQLVPSPSRSAMMPFAFPDFNTNRLLMSNMPNNGMSFSSSSYVSMTRGPDGRQQVYKATSSSKSGPGGVCETKKTVQDSRTGVQKMAIGHHIGERAHVVEKQKNVHTGEEEETVDLINLDEDDAVEFDHEFERKATAMYGGSSRRYVGGAGHTEQLALPAPPIAAIPSSATAIDEEPSTSSEQKTNITSSTNSTIPLVSTNQTSRRGMQNIVSGRRAMRTPTSSPLVSPSGHTTSTSVHPHPYNTQARRQQHRGMKGSYHQHNHSSGTH